MQSTPHCGRTFLVCLPAYCVSLKEHMQKGWSTIALVMVQGARGSTQVGTFLNTPHSCSSLFVSLTRGMAYVKQAELYSRTHGAVCFISDRHKSTYKNEHFYKESQRRKKGHANKSFSGHLSTVLNMSCSCTLFNMSLSLRLIASQSNTAAFLQIKCLALKILLQTSLSIPVL